MSQKLSLSVGDAAPNFTLSTTTAEGPKKITLSESYQKGSVLLLFVPMAFTPVCTKEFCTVTSELSLYANLNTTVYGISGDNPFAQEAWAAKEKIKVPLLSDYEHHVATAYGIAYESFLPEIGLGMSGVPKRSAFLIDRAGIIQYAEVNDDPKQLPNFEKIKAKLAELK
ncbi:MAG: redoxin domain-containing protein [Chthoniobacterales bacterium]|nr:redoxin domain-containing protein [Chthoniobacterales bacterium]